LQSVLKEPSATVSLASRVENTIHDKVTAASECSPMRMPSVVDRCEMLDHENSNLRQLLASVTSILRDLSQSISSADDCNLPDEGARNVSTHEISELPVTWMYERVKNEIEASLNILSDHIIS